MKILVIGRGGREHAICYKLAQSSKVSKIYCARGNAGIAKLAQCVDIDEMDLDSLLKFAIEEKIHLTVVGGENPLCAGIVDLFERHSLKIFGPSKLCAEFEGSKNFSKRFMEKHGIPTAKYKHFTKYEDAIVGLGKFNYPLVIKADGLCMGKGVVICNSHLEATSVLHDIFIENIFKEGGSSVVIEEFLTGIEASLLCLVSGEKIIPLESARDYKKAYDNDMGKNTGGVGCYSPNENITKEVMLEIDEILKKISLGLVEENMDFKGILFIGFMIEDSKPKILEFNVRFGDPETEVLMPRLKSDLVELFLKTIDGTIEEKDLVWDESSCTTVVLTSGGYPDEYKKGYEILGLDKLKDNIIVFHNGTTESNNNLVTNGGRVLSITALDSSVELAANKVYKAIDNIQFKDMYFRKDIGRH